MHGKKPIRNIFGSTLVQAYSIESERAIYPRVVLETAIVPTVHREFQARSKDTAPIFLLTDVDGCVFVNQFGRDVRDLESGVPSKRKKALKNRKRYASRVKTGIELTDVKAAMKWRGIAKQLQDQLTE